ncbi:YbhN family protein [Chitinophaga pinensis]|uniref:Flippase-like domain-containing protein n=1 Tax=Chitinophaga pinensis TaxID=79329 RepID=A0A5C6LLJ7_9BACT|nr:lysylphosphatidylglycerol synthase transmembrane domain-containing protein [Chitinophaga pinensis]TWV97453.1 flippase-like domain-containing protein [Chitinophaga pinensis]
MLSEEKIEIAEETMSIKASTATESSTKQLFNKSMILKGAMWLGLLTIASVAVVFFYSHTGDTIRAFSSIQLKYMPICLGMVFIDLMLGSWRNHIFIQKLKPGLSHWASFKANVANMFMGAITPFHSGAGPAQLYVYNRHGVKVLDGFIVSLINMGATLLFMPLAGLLAIWAMNNQLESGLITILLKYGFSVFFIFGAVFILAFWKPLWIGSVLMKITAAISRIWPAKKDGITKWADTSYANILHYQQICKKLLTHHPLLFPLSLLITTLLYLNKYCMQYVILLGLGIHADILQVISIQILIQFMIYFAPSPGGSGFAEAGIAVLFSRIVPTSILPVFTLLQRSFLLFFPALIGAFVVLNLLKTHTIKVHTSNHG